VEVAIGGSVPERADGVHPSFDAAFEPLALLAYRVARRVLGGGGDAENVAAETLARAQVHWRSVHDHAEAWVVTVATRLAVREARRGQRWPPNIQSGAVGDDADAAVARVDLARALGRLSRRQRQAVALRYVGDLTDAEAAAAMGCSVPSFRTHCGRGLTALRAELGEIPNWAPDQQEGHLA
jgi:RNA polymerase sigma factor (sigma-70 family)